MDLSNLGKDVTLAINVDTDEAEKRLDRIMERFLALDKLKGALTLNVEEIATKAAERVVQAHYEAVAIVDKVKEARNASPQHSAAYEFMYDTIGECITSKNMTRVVIAQSQPEAFDKLLAFLKKTHEAHPSTRFEIVRCVRVLSAVI